MLRMPSYLSCMTSCVPQYVNMFFTEHRNRKCPRGRAFAWAAAGPGAGGSAELFGTLEGWTRAASDRRTRVRAPLLPFQRAFALSLDRRPAADDWSFRRRRRQNLKFSDIQAVHCHSGPWTTKAEAFGRAVRSETAAVSSGFGALVEASTR